MKSISLIVVCSLPVQFSRCASGRPGSSSRRDYAERIPSVSATASRAFALPPEFEVSTFQSILQNDTEICHFAIRQTPTPAFADFISDLVAVVAGLSGSPARFRFRFRFYSIVFDLGYEHLLSDPHFSLERR